MEKRVLVLTSWYMPVQIVTWRDAITSLYLGKVEAVVDYSEVVRSPSVAMQIPAVVRTVRKQANVKRGIKFSRPNVYARDGGRCQYCLARLPMGRLTYDHVFPRSRGGETTWTNVVMACKPCNAKKDDKTPEEAGMALHCVPRRPSSLPIEPLRLSGFADIPEEWAAFATA
jgi:5-methylcytosine-specific restriction endonuclease McrA